MINETHCTPVPLAGKVEELLPKSPQCGNPSLRGKNTFCKRERERVQFNIGRKIAFPFVVILVLMAVAVGITMEGFNQLIGSLETTQEEAAKQAATGNVRFSIAQLLMYTNDYIITGKEDYRQKFERQRVQVVDYYSRLLEYDLSGEELTIANSINADLDSIYVYGHRIFSISHPQSSLEAAALMERMDYAFGDAVNRKTTEIFNIVFRRIEEHRIQSARKTEQMLTAIYAVFFIVLNVSLTVVYLSVQRIAKPIRTVTKAANAIANGDYSQRPVVSTRDEVGLLARSFSQMAEAIETTQRELELRRRFTENIVASVPSGLLAIGKESEVTSVNRSFCELFNVKRQENVGQPLDAVLRIIGLSEECRTAIAARVQFRNLECACFIHGKGERTLNLTLSGIRVAEEEEEEEEEEALLGIDDITERQRAEEALRSSEERYRTLFEESKDAIYISTEGEMLDINPAGVELFGYNSKEELLRVDIGRDLYWNPEKREEFKQTMRRQGYVQDFELELKRKDGLKVTVLETATALRDSNIVTYRGILRNITAQRVLEEQLRQAQKMESLGALAGGIAHDFNNILAIIMAHSSLLSQKGKQNPEKVKKSAEEILTATERGASVVERLLIFSRKKEPVFESVQINDIINDTIRIIREVFPKVIDIQTNLKNDLPTITADSTQIQQVLLNLCVNARDAMPKGGRLSIATRAVTGKSLYPPFTDATSGRYVNIEISDNGTGMDEEIRQRIFDPFFTTKEPGKGTGLGLSTVFGIVENHNGFIEVQSKPGEGTTFSVFLPIIDEIQREYKKTPMPIGGDDVKGGSETVLVIEDEEMLRDLVKTILTSQGYTVLTAADGEEGIEMYYRHQNDISVVISDLGLPKLGGEEVFKRIRKIDAKVKVILASGYIDPEKKSELYKAGAQHFIHKPYLPDDILRKVRDVIDNN